MAEAKAPGGPLSHAELSKIAVRWLKRNRGAGGPGCHIAMSETKSGWGGEIPDAIGFRATGWEDGSIVVEVKTSRSDFLADRKKPHRQDGKGMGNWRYFMCPEGLIRSDELPAGWGLLWVNSRGHVKPIAGPAVHYREGGYSVVTEQTAAWRLPSDLQREQWLLVKLLNRVGDPEQLNANLKLAYSEKHRMANRVNEQNEELSRLRTENYNLNCQLKSATEVTP
ncbi:adenylosuccinate synthase [Pseudomonas migulae]|uniref:adenylosuccinate synthase n=1 Tax=Pseudomonas migulae TaxID=78543 RepID=UPI003715AADF